MKQYRINNYDVWYDDDSPYVNDRYCGEWVDLPKEYHPFKYIYDLPEKLINKLYRLCGFSTKRKFDEITESFIFLNNRHEFALSGEIEVY